jgi:hypothetical protein
LLKFDGLCIPRIDPKSRNANAQRAYGQKEKLKDSLDLVFPFTG